MQLCNVHGREGPLKTNNGAASLHCLCVWCSYLCMVKHPCNSNIYLIYTPLPTSQWFALNNQGVLMAACCCLKSPILRTCSNVPSDLLSLATKPSMPLIAIVSGSSLKGTRLSLPSGVKAIGFGLFLNQITPISAGHPKFA